jgi:hypothetical protein
MASFQTKNSNLGKFWTALKWKMLVCFMVIRNILWSFSMFNGQLVICHIFSRFGVLCQEKSGNPARNVFRQGAKKQVNHRLAAKTCKTAEVFLSCCSAGEKCITCHLKQFKGFFAVFQIVFSSIVIVALLTFAASCRRVHNSLGVGTTLR